MFSAELKKGSTEMLVLSLVESRARHGYEIGKLIEARSDGRLTFALPTLYPTLLRLENRGWIKGRWVEKAGERQRCFYRLTSGGPPRPRQTAGELAGLRRGRQSGDGRAAMRDWDAFVRSHSELPGLRPERESRIVKELAAQLEDFYREAIARGATDAEADAHAARQIRDWERMTQDLWLADRPNARPPIERLADRLDADAIKRKGAGSPCLRTSCAMRVTRFGNSVKTPGFAIVAILTLALGIGATSAIFSVVNGVLLRPLPYPEPDAPRSPVSRSCRSTADSRSRRRTSLDWRQAERPLRPHRRLHRRHRDVRRHRRPGARRHAATVSWDLFDLLKVSPMLGRRLYRGRGSARERTASSCISYGMWQRRFGGDPNVLGRSLTLSGEPVTIVGVMPAGFLFPVARHGALAPHRAESRQRDARRPLPRGDRPAQTRSLCSLRRRPR